MSARIEARDFVKAFKGAGTKDWHGLTREVEGELTVKDFPPIIREKLRTASGVELPMEVLVSTDDNMPCGIPFNPNSFGHILPPQAMDMVQTALAGTGYKIHRLGMLANRTIWFVSIYLEELASVQRDGHRFFLNFSGGLDGQMSPQWELSDIRVVCFNTLSVSRLIGETLFRIKQTKNALVRLEDGEKAIEEAVGMAKIFNETLEQLENTPCSVDEARAVYAGDVARHGGDFSRKMAKDGSQKECRARNIVDTLTELFRAGDGNHGKTRGDLANGLTQFFTRGDAKSKKDPFKRFESSDFGGFADRKAGFVRDIAVADSFDELRLAGVEALATN